MRRTAVSTAGKWVTFVSMRLAPLAPIENKSWERITTWVNWRFGTAGDETTVQSCYYKWCDDVLAGNGSDSNKLAMD